MIKILQNRKIAYTVEEIHTGLEMDDLVNLFKENPYYFHLESGMDEEKLGRFSFLGGFPFLIFKSRKNKIEVISNSDHLVYLGDPLTELKKIWDKFRTDPPMVSTDLRDVIPFLGGGVGYFGYEFGNPPLFPGGRKSGLHLPDCCFMFIQTVFIFDRLKQKKYISVISFETSAERSKRELAKGLTRIKEKIFKLEKQKNSPLPPFPFPGRPRSNHEIKPLTEKKEYIKNIQKIKNYIEHGHVYEVCLTQRFETPYTGSSYGLYQCLKEITPAPFSGFLSFPEVKVICASPERFLKIDSTGWAESRPIKGTRRRGTTPREDDLLREKLENSSKDRAENLMIVDLVRNDFGKVCQNKTIRVTELFKVESYSTLFQMVSTIRGKLSRGTHPFDLLRACFPGGSMTGAPKIKAMEIIQELEPVERGIYSGAIGYLNILGNLDLNMVIRTLIIRDHKAFFHVGGAIVADSVPEEEYQETLDKARALITALRLAGPFPA